MAQNPKLAALSDLPDPSVRPARPEGWRPRNLHPRFHHVLSRRHRYPLYDEEILLRENESIFVPLGCMHRLENPGKVPLNLIEVQSGAYLGEDDIVRVQDIYDRV
jgi:mannose-6-phosphate isomerase-like protein (cupin superfamily)